MFKSILPLCSIVGLRFLGLFIVLPVLSLYALSLHNSNEFLAGVSISIYAISQTFLQTPFGAMSDKIGRKQTIIIGLAIFMIGSVVCAMSSSIYTLILGRFLQGAGAISSVLMAMISDLTREEKRTQAMATLGGIIAMSFTISIFLGPLIGGHYGTDKLFWIVAILTLIAMISILTPLIPNPPKVTFSYQNKKEKVSKIFKNSNLKKMFIIFFIHSFIMIIAFLIIPIALNQNFGWQEDQLWMAYLPALLCGLAGMIISAVIDSRFNRGKELFIFAILSIGFGFYLMGFAKNQTVFIFGISAVFVGINIFEPLLQSFASKFAKAHQRGITIGISNSFGYLGAFLGGSVGGFVLQKLSKEYLSIFVIMICVFWLIWVLTLKKFRVEGNIYFPLNNFKKDSLETLKSLKGIKEYYINESERLIIIKYEKEILNKDEIERFLNRG